MKITVIALLAFLSLSAFAKKAKVTVPGMTCQMCVSAMKKNFKSAVKNSDQDIKVDLENKTVELNFNKEISEAEIKKRVKAAGYSAIKIDWI